MSKNKSNKEEPAEIPAPLQEGPATEPVTDDIPPEDSGEDTTDVNGVASYDAEGNPLDAEGNIIEYEDEGPDILAPECWRPVEEGKRILNYRRNRFPEGKEGDDLFIQYKTECIDRNYSIRQVELEIWHNKEIEKLEDLKERMTGKATPQSKIEKQIARLQQKLLLLQNGD